MCAHRGTAAQGDRSTQGLETPAPQLQPPQTRTPCRWQRAWLRWRPASRPGPQTRCRSCRLRGVGGGWGASSAEGKGLAAGCAGGRAMPRHGPTRGRSLDPRTNVDDAENQAVQGEHGHEGALLVARHGAVLGHAHQIVVHPLHGAQADCGRGTIGGSQQACQSVRLLEVAWQSTLASSVLQPDVKTAPPCCQHR